MLKGVESLCLPAALGLILGQGAVGSSGASAGLCVATGLFCNGAAASAKVFAFNGPEIVEGLEDIV